MAYTEDLKQLIKRAEATRPRRLAKKREGWEFPKISLAEKEDRLTLFKVRETHFTSMIQGMNPWYASTCLPRTRQTDTVAAML